MCRDERMRAKKVLKENYYIGVKREWKMECDNLSEDAERERKRFKYSCKTKTRKEKETK